jgi:hypothetical protein
MGLHICQANFMIELYSNAFCRRRWDVCFADLLLDNEEATLSESGDDRENNFGFAWRDKTQ